jgi:uncharacterized Zn-binding protein involved in type VI secretion
MMVHELMWSVLNAQHTNATLAGNELRRAAEDLARLSDSNAILAAFDLVGERIIGAAMMKTDTVLRTFDYSQSIPVGSRCLLVGGQVAGPAGIAAMAGAMVAAGAETVDVVMLGEWSEPIDHVRRCRTIGSPLHAKVA